MRKFTLAWAYLASCAGRRVNSASQEQRSTVVAELDQRDSSVPGELNGLASLLLKHQASCAFAPSRCPRLSLQRLRRGTSTMQEAPSTEPSGDWELDFYSRPVLGPTGKKLWELLITDSTGSFYHAETVPSNCVNSRELRQRVQRLIRESEVKPAKIRYFRPQMKNMISIALNEIQDVSNRPSRTTYALYDFIQAREKDVWSQMAGYRKVPQNVALNMDSRKCPNFLKPQRFLFVTLPLSQFLPGGRIAAGQEIAIRHLCPLPQRVKELPLDFPVPGIIWYSQKSRPLAAALDCSINGMEISGVKVVPEIREMHLQAGLDTNWLTAKFSDEELYRQALDFEGGKEAVGGLHFLSIQEFPLAGPNALYQGLFGDFNRWFDSYFSEEPYQTIEATTNPDFDAETQSLTRPDPEYPTGIWLFRDP